MFELDPIVRVVLLPARTRGQSVPVQVASLLENDSVSELGDWFLECRRGDDWMPVVVARLARYWRIGLEVGKNDGHPSSPSTSEHGPRWYGPAGAWAGMDAAGNLRLVATVETGPFRFLIHDHFTFEHGMLRVQRTWEYQGSQPGVGVALSCGVDFPGKAEGPVGGPILPGVNYHENRYAAANRLVPRVGSRVGDIGLYEEHRFPIPMACAAHLTADRELGAAMIARPGKVPYGRWGDDQWWSLGMERLLDGWSFLLVSGLVATNGVWHSVYGRQNHLVACPPAYLDLPAGVQVTKTFYLAWGEDDCGWSFRPLLWRSHSLLAPQVAPALSPENVVELKLRALRSRYVENNDEAGFLTVPDKEKGYVGNVYSYPPGFLYGWTGQCLKMATCALIEGKHRGDSALAAMGTNSVMFFAGESLKYSGLVPLYYYLATEEKAAPKGTWRGLGSGADWVSSRAYGETVRDLAMAVTVGRTFGEEVGLWESALRRACDFLASPRSRSSEVLYPRFWTTAGQPVEEGPMTAGVFSVSGLACGYEVLAEKDYLEAAVALMDAYAASFLLGGPRFYGATLDAQCEDKEGAAGFLRAALDLYRITGEARYLDWAARACDWAMSFVYFWDPGFRPGTSCHGRMPVVGWPAVSVQNQHIDVWAPLVDMMELARHTKDERYAEMAKVTFNALTYSIARPGEMWGYNVPGEQAEQFFQTNYYQGPFDVDAWRGGYNLWNPAWIIALVLESAIYLCGRHPALWSTGIGARP